MALPRSLCLSTGLCHSQVGITPFEVITNASQDLGACGAVLMQAGYPIAFESRNFSPMELRYMVTVLALLVVVHALRVWRC